MNVPLIRSAALAPITRWMQDQGLDPYPLLKQSGLGWFEDQNPLEPIPLRFAALLLRNLARQEGPDTPWRIVQDRGFFELGLLSSLVLKAATPRGVFALVEMAMAAHCTHEVFSVDRSVGNALVVEDGWALGFDQETLHFIQQYNTAMAAFICNLTSEPEPFLTEVQMVPHPEHEFSHLRSWLGHRVSGRGMNNLRITIPTRVADAQIEFESCESEMLDVALDWAPLRDGTSTSYSINLLLNGMLRAGKPSIDLVAAAIGISRRSLQRKLADEGTSFATLLDDARHKLALEYLSVPNPSIAAISKELGYANQSAFTRAFRRWQGVSPVSTSKRD